MSALGFIVNETVTQMPLVGLLDRVQAQFVFMVLLFIYHQ